MKTTNKWVAIMLLVVGTLFTACSKDDDNKTPTVDPTVDPLVGVWKAETLSYSMESHSGTYPYDHQIFKGGCTTDFITINANNTVVLKENNKVEEECVDQESTGTWSAEKINVKDADRQIISVDDTKLVLVYDLFFMGQTLAVTVEYSRQLVE